MSSHCIPMSACNTGMAGWLDGEHPSEPYLLVSRTVCMHSGSSCCHLKISVKIRNCDGFYVYQLPALASCNARYCGVNGKTCPETVPYLQISTLLSELSLTLFSIHQIRGQQFSCVLFWDGIQNGLSCRDSFER